MTYEELSIYGTLRKVGKCGPFGMFSKLLHDWGHILKPTEASICRTYLCISLH